jgi:hypothetical protein
MDRSANGLGLIHCHLQLDGGGDGGVNLRQHGADAATVSMMLAPGWRKMITSTEGFPLAYPALRRSSTESTTWPTSAMRTEAPLW